jgi:hypothetical protein
VLFSPQIIARTRVFTSGGGGGGGGAAPGPNATAFLARTSGLDTTHRNAYIDFINGLDTDSLFAKFDWLQVYATQDSTTALLNLVSSSYNATLVTAPTFTADRGFTGVSGNYIDSGFNPSTAGSPNYVQNSSHISLWSVIDIGGVALSPMGIDSFLGETEIFPRYNDGNAYFRINGSAISGVTNASPVGHFIANRSSSTAVQGYKNGSSVLTATDNSHAPLNHNFPVCAQYHYDSSTLVISTHQIAMASMGSSLNSTDVTNLYNRLRTYMTAVGVP